MKNIKPESLNKRFKKMLLLAEKIRKTAKQTQLKMEATK